MEWSVEYTAASRRQLRKLDPQIGRKIVAYMRDVVEDGFPYAHGKSLTGLWHGHWRYRVGDYRVICILENAKFLISVVKTGHRSDVYER